MSNVRDRGVIDITLEEDGRYVLVILDDMKWEPATRQDHGRILQDGNLSDSEIKWLLEKNITTIVDLREEKEYVALPCRLENEEGFIYYHLPVTGGGDTPESPEAVVKTYLGMLDEQMDKIVSTIMKAESNVMYFCGAGKDRTGVVSALILKKLGYSDQTVIDDYMESKDNLMGFLRSYVKDHPEIDINIIIPNENNIKVILESV